MQDTFSQALAEVHGVLRRGAFHAPFWHLLESGSMVKTRRELDREIKEVQLARAGLSKHRRRLLSSQTSLRTELEEIVSAHDSLLYGRCATFAIAAHRLTRLPIYGLVGVDEDSENEVLIHAYIRLDDETRFDLKGPRTLSEIYEDFMDDPAFPDADEVRLTESEVAKLATGSARCPSLREVTPVARRVWEIAEQLKAAQ
jgi:hypothetical protein